MNQSIDALRLSYSKTLQRHLWVLLLSMGAVFTLILQQMSRAQATVRTEVENVRVKVGELERTTKALEGSLSKLPGILQQANGSAEAIQRILGGVDTKLQTGSSLRDALDRLSVDLAEPRPGATPNLASMVLKLKADMDVSKPGSFAWSLNGLGKELTPLPHDAMQGNLRTLLDALKNDLNSAQKGTAAHAISAFVRTISLPGASQVADGSTADDSSLAAAIATALKQVDALRGQLNSTEPASLTHGIREINALLGPSSSASLIEGVRQLRDALGTPTSPVNAANGEAHNLPLLTVLLAATDSLKALNENLKTASTGLCCAEQCPPPN